jgi:hypothetical protein
MSQFWENYTQQDIDKILETYPNFHLTNSRAMPLLISQIRNESLNTQKFREYADRVIRILLEET